MCACSHTLEHHRALQALSHSVSPLLSIQIARHTQACLKQSSLCFHSNPFSQCWPNSPLTSTYCDPTADLPLPAFSPVIECILEPLSPCPRLRRLLLLARPPPPLPLPPSSGSLAPCRRPHLSGAAVRHWWLRLLELICLWSALSSRVWLSATLTTGSHTPVPAALHPLLRWDLSVLLAPAVFGSDQNTNHLFKL